MKELICKHLGKAVAFGIIMTVIGFFGGNTVFTFPPGLVGLPKTLFDSLRYFPGSLYAV